MSQRVLLASLNAGGGHNALRDAFVSVLEANDPRHERFVPISWNSSDRFIERFYSFTMHHAPRIQGTLYALSEKSVMAKLAHRINPNLFIEAQAILRDARPDMVVSCHAVLTLMLVRAKHVLGLSVPIVSAIPDYGIPSGIFNPPDLVIRPDSLIVMSDDTQAHYRHTEGLGPTQLHLSGFVTRPAFSELGAQLRSLTDRRARRVSLLRELEPEYPQLSSLDPSRPTLLFMGGSAWTEKTRPVLEALLALPEFSSRINVIVVCGRDPKFEAELRALTHPWKNFAIFGFASAATLARLMAIADVPVLGSLAPATMHELMEIGCGPLLLYHFIPGTERPHTVYIREQRIGRYEPDTSRMLDLIMQVTGFTPARPDVHELLRAFPGQASRLRAQSRARANQLPDFLESLLGPAPVQRFTSRVTPTREDLPALPA